MRKLSLIAFLLLLLSPALFAQTGSVRGKVTEDSTGLPLENVSVQVSGSQTTVKTSSDGTYSIQVGQGGRLVFTFVGYEPVTRDVGAATEMNVSLKPMATSLDEYVVIGYQTVRRKDLTSSVSSVQAKDLKDIPLSSAAEALTGRLAGVQVTTTEGAPGAEVQIRVRGGGSITQDNSPLYIVDGIQVENALSILSPQEIESVDVLKDAASTSIYGARGANGVVLITTKGGREMKTRVTYNCFSGVRSIVNRLPVMKPYDFVRYQYDIYNFNTNEQTRNTFTDNYGRFEDLDLYKSMPFTDWQDRVFGRDAFGQTHILGVAGGTKTTSFNFTLNHNDEDGIMLNSGFQRTMASFKFDHKVSDRLRIGFNTRYGRQRIEGVGSSNTGTQSSNRLRNSVRFRPFVAPGLENQVDEFDPDYANLTNLTSPVLLANQELRYDYRNDLNTNVYFSLELAKNLVFKSVFGITSTERRINAFNGPATGVARQNNDQPVVQMQRNEIFSLTNSNTVTYRKQFGSMHTLDLLAGQEIWQQDFKGANTLVKWLPVDITPDQAFAGIQKATPPDGLIQDAPSTNQTGERLSSFFGRANYSYDGKYIVTLSARRDGSSKFAPQNRNAIFPSAALAWRISQEDFMANLAAVSDLKLRLSYGTAGNNRIGMDLYKTMFGASSNDGYAFGQAVIPGYVATDLANVNLVWETTVSRNLGLDFGLFNNRLTGSVDLYMNNVRDLLLQKPIPQTTGYISQFQNIGETENRGIEIQLGTTVISSKDFTWNMNYNMSFNKNKVVSLGLDPSGNPQNFILAEAGWINATYQDFIVQVGQPLGQFYGYLTDGYYGVDDFDYNAATQVYTLKPGIANSRNIALGNREPQPGDLKLKKLTRDGSDMVSTDDRTILGSSQPKFIGGFNQQFAYKNFDASLFVNFSYGNQVYNANKIEFTTQYLYRDNNMLEDMNGRFRRFDDNGVQVNDPEQLKALNANATLWSPPLGQYFLHSYAIEDGSFLRVSNLTLGYSIPRRILERTKVFSQFRLYATVNNLLTLTNYSGYDPEANTRRRTPLTPGVDYAAYPRSRYILAGVNIAF